MDHRQIRRRESEREEARTRGKEVLEVEVEKDACQLPGWMLVWMPAVAAKRNANPGAACHLLDWMLIWLPAARLGARFLRWPRYIFS